MKCHRHRGEPRCRRRAMAYVDLAGQGVGLVPIANASRFQWPGYWIAVLAGTPSPETDGCADVRLAVQCVLSPQNSALLGERPPISR